MLSLKANERSIKKERSFVKIHSFYFILILFSFLYSIPTIAAPKENVKMFTRQGGCGTICPTNVSCPVTASGPCGIFSCITADNASFGTLTASCETINGNLTVNDNMSIGDDLFVENDAIIFGDECIEGDLGVGGNTTIGGNTLIEGSLTVLDGAIINGPLTVNGPETINGSLTVTGDETLNQNLIVGGAGTINGLLSANGGLQVFNGATINSGGLVVNSGGANIVGDVTITGTQTVDNLDVLGNLTVSENTFLNGCVTTVNGDLVANGPVVMNRGLTIASGNEVIASGDLILSLGNLTVGGSSLFGGPITANSGATFNEGLTVLGGGTIAAGNFAVSNCGNMTIGGNLTVNGTITSPSPAQLARLLITDTTNSTSPDTGALVVNGGVGIAQDLWLGGSEYFANVANEGGVPSPFNYYEETCVTMAFQFDAGLPATFVQVQIVRVGSLVNLLIPAMTLNQGAGFGDVHTLPGWELPPRFRPACPVRGASSTIIHDGIGELGEYEVRPDGTIIFGLPGPVLGPQPFTSGTPVMVDINTITYNILDCGCTPPPTF